MGYEEGGFGGGEVINCGGGLVVLLLLFIGKFWSSFSVFRVFNGGCIGTGFLF